jgi:uncharacterized protein YodC (DUF2158 family)
MAFKPGDVVVLKSGGPAMTVASVEENDVKCLWIGEEGELYREEIPAVALELIESEDDFDEDGDAGADGDADENGDEDQDEPTAGSDAGPDSEAGTLRRLRKG